MTDEQSDLPTPGGADRQTEDPVEDAGQSLIDEIRQRLPEGPVEPEELAGVLAEFTSVEYQQQSFLGPLPPPAVLADYEKVLPGLAGQLVERANKEQAFRHEGIQFDQQTQREAIRHDATKTYVGQALAFVLAMTAIGGGVWLLAHDKSAVGIGTIISALVALVVAFVTGKYFDATAISQSDSE